MATTQPAADGLKREEHDENIDKSIGDPNTSTSIRGGGTREEGEEPCCRCSKFKDRSLSRARTRLNCNPFFPNIPYLP